MRLFEKDARQRGTCKEVRVANAGQGGALHSEHANGDIAVTREHYSENLKPDSSSKHMSSSSSLYLYNLF